MRLVRLIFRLEEQKVAGRLRRDFSFACTVRSHLASFNMSPRGMRGGGGGGGGLACVGVRRTLAQFGDAKQAMGERKSDPVETGLTGSAATALRICDQLNV